MDISAIFFLLILSALICEFIDSGLGMMYGTILSPLLIVLGFDPQSVIPSILFSQALGGMVATIGHHRYKNADFSIKSTDFKIASVIYLCGIVSVISGALLAVKMPKEWLQIYIGGLVSIMGLVVILRRNFTFSWKKVIGIGMLSAFNKALSGGGYGPLVASGLIISGKDGRSSIGTTDFAEAPICITAFLVWAILKQSYPPLDILVPLTIGAMIGASFGPYCLSKVKNNDKLITVIGWLVLVMGLFCAFNILKA